MKKLLVVFFSLFSAISANANEVCSITKNDISDANSILEHSTDYLEQLNAISFLSFKGLNTSAETAASLMEEKEQLKANFTNIVNSASAIAQRSTECAAREWNTILFSTATSIRMMEDLERFNLIKDCEVCWFSVVVLNQSYEKLSEKLNKL